jgi:hypothetical protein
MMPRDSPKKFMRHKISFTLLNTQTLDYCETEECYEKFGYSPKMVKYLHKSYPHFCVFLL